MKITIVGLGYMGLPTALLISQNEDYDVLGYDIDSRKVKMIENGELPFEEKGLEELFNKNKENFKATDELEESDVFLLSLPTPINKQKRCDLSYIDSAIDSLIPILKEGNLIILESTVPPGTTKRIKKKVSQKKEGILFGYVSEKAIPGNTIYEMVHNDRVAGCDDKKSKELMKDLYGSFVEGEIHFTDLNTAESVKLFENTFRDVNIALANELSKVSEDLGVNVYEVIKLANHHPRVDILQPGPGVGGHCIAVDPWFLLQNTTNGNLIKSSREINDKKPSDVVKRIEEVTKDIKNPKISILGLAYKKNVDDDRESPSYTIIDLLESQNYKVSVHDPHVKNYKIDSIDKCLDNSDCIVLVTDHDYYKKIDLNDYNVRNKIIVDTRDCFEKVPEDFEYHLIGSSKK